MKYSETDHEAWLIEKQDHRGELPTWWCAEGSTERLGGFVSDPNHAVRFTRKVDAERVAKLVCDMSGVRAKATAHLWFASRYEGDAPNTPEPNT